MKADIYGEPTIITVNNVIAKVHSPILTKEEYNRRLELVKKAVVQMMLSKDK